VGGSASNGVTFAVTNPPPAVVVQAAACTNTATTVTCTLGANTTAGNLLLLSSENDGAGPTVASITGGGGTWQKLGATTFNYNTKDLELWAAPNLAGGTKQITVTYSGFVDAAVGVLELTGLKTASFVDATCTDANRSPDGTAQTTLQASGSCTPAQNNTVVVLAGGTTGSVTYAAGTGFTLPIQAARPNAATALELAVQSTASSVTGALTIGQADQWATIRRAFICNGACPP